MTADIRSAEEIRARLNEIAPYTPGDMGPVQLARWFAMEAQVVWARMLDPGHPIDPRDIGALHGYFAAAHALLTLNEHAPAVAEETAGSIASAINSSGDVGEWLWFCHDGDQAEEVADLARRLAELTVVDAAGHVHAREPA